MRATPVLRAVFRVAAGPRMGFGHVTRARALAHALGLRPVLSIRGGAVARQAAARMGCLVLPAGVDRFAEANLLIVDDPSPIEAAAWVRRARRHGVLSVGVQDAGAADCHADLVVDGGLCARPTTSARRLVGSRYCLLDTSSARPSRARRRRETRVLIALGGGGHVRQLARRLASAVADRCPSAEIVVAPGFLTSPPPALRRGRWIVSPRGLASQLSVSGIAIVAGGQTLYEACSLGVPTVSVAVVRAQRPAIEACASAGAVLDAGGPEMDDATAARVANGVARLFESRELRERVSARARLLIDGRGAQRVARRIASLVRTRRVARV